MRSRHERWTHRSRRRRWGTHCAARAAGSWQLAARLASQLPDLYSHLGSRGIVPVTILQSYKQGVRVWGEPGMDTLWSAATSKLIGAGIDDARTAEDLSRLIGEHDVPTPSTSRGPGGASPSTSLRRERIFGPDQIRALPKGTALLYATGTRVALLTLQPWYDGPQAGRIGTAQRDAQAALQQRARAAAVTA